MHPALGEPLERLGVDAVLQVQDTRAKSRFVVIGEGGSGLNDDVAVVHFLVHEMNQKPAKRTPWPADAGCGCGQVGEQSRMDVDHPSGEPGKPESGYA